jgi:hypothetical protein
MADEWTAELNAVGVGVQPWIHHGGSFTTQLEAAQVDVQRALADGLWKRQPEYHTLDLLEWQPTTLLDSDQFDPLTNVFRLSAYWDRKTSRLVLRQTGSLHSARFYMDQLARQLAPYTLRWPEAALRWPGQLSLP